MLQIRLMKPGKFMDSQLDSQTLVNDLALVKVHRIGICGTDIHAFAGRQPFFNYPRVLGHELGVEIVGLADNTVGFCVGDRCSVEPYFSCGRCKPCQKNRPNCCVNLKVLGVHTDGGMSEFMAVPTSHLHTSATLTYDQLALVETLGIGLHAVERAGLVPQDSVLIVGAGPIGLSVLQYVQAAGIQPTVLEVNPIRRAFVGKFGANGTDKIEKELFDVVFDATGNQDAMNKSFDYVGFGGKLVFVGLMNQHVQFHDPDFHRREMTILASRNSAFAFPKIIADIEAKRIDTTPWITHRIKLPEVTKQFGEISRQLDLVKAMIEVD